MITQWLAQLDDPALSLDIAWKMSAVLATGWLLHFILRGHNPRWCVLLWRGVAVGVLAIPLLVLFASDFSLAVIPEPPAREVLRLPAAPAPWENVLAATAPASQPGQEIAPPAASMEETLPPQSNPAKSVAQPPVAASVSSETSAFDWKAHAPGLLCTLWAIIACVLIARILLASRHVRRIIAQASPAPRSTRDLLNRVAGELGISAEVRLCFSSETDCPFLSGLRRPVIVLPECMARCGYAEELPAILIHELAHWRSRDLWWTGLIRAQSIALWFHPLVWRTRAMHESACEKVCDAVAASRVGGASAYSRVLARMALEIAGKPTLAGGIPMARSSEIIDRLAALRRRAFSAPLARRYRALSIGLSAIALVSIGTVRFVQAEPKEKVEKKSVQPKPGPPRLPTLTAPAKIVEGQRALLGYEYPQSEWRRDDDQADWPAYVRIDNVDYECIHYLAPFANEGLVGFLDLNDGLLTLVGRGRFGTIAWPPGKHRVALVYKDLLVRSHGDPDHPVHYDELVGEAIEFEVVDKDSPIAQTLRAGKKYEGKTLEEWLTELGSCKYEARKQAKAALVRIGQPAVARLVQFIEETDPRASFAAKTLGEMGPESRQAVPRLLGLVRRHMRHKETGSRSWTCYCAVLALSKMPWAAEEVTPVLRELVQHGTGRDSLRRNAMRALAELSPEAVPMLREWMEHDRAHMRRWATDILAETLINSGQASRLQFYREVIERDRFDENVPDILPQLYLGDYSIGPDSKPHPLTQEIKALYRQRLEENPDPQTAWNLARIIQRHLAATQLAWTASTSVVSSRWLRVDPAENFVGMADVLEHGFRDAEKDSELWRKLGTGLAKVRLLQGDWQGMNAALGQMGEAPIPDEERPRLAAPPVDWTNLRAKWQAAALSMRSGDCSLVLRFEKDGRGLAGAHVLLQPKPRPYPSHVWRRGISNDSILFSPCPIPRYSNESFGYPAEGKRARTRYAVSDESGMVRFDKLPEMDLHMEVLIPTGNFTEQSRDWELLIETQPGRFEKTARLGHPEAIHPHDPEAQLRLKSGTRFEYPKLLVRAKKG